VWGFEGLMRLAAILAHPTKFAAVTLQIRHYNLAG
jgi:hypothetical protein